MAKIYLLSCVKSKQSKKCAAEDMYISPLFRKMLQYAKKQKPSKIFILSAKYGVLELSDFIEPYEKTLNKMGKNDREIWAKDVLQQLKNKVNLDKDNFVFLAGQRYRENLIPAIKHYTIPMEGMAFGKQLQWLEAQINE